MVEGLAAHTGTAARQCAGLKRAACGAELAPRVCVTRGIRSTVQTHPNSRTWRYNPKSAQAVPAGVNFPGHGRTLCASGWSGICMSPCVGHGKESVNALYWLRTPRIRPAAGSAAPSYASQRAVTGRAGPVGACTTSRNVRRWPHGVGSQHAPHIIPPRDII